jgi:hypothetical protein
MRSISVVLVSHFIAIGCVANPAAFNVLRIF